MTIRTFTLSVTPIAFLGMLLGACATTVPSHLVEARQAYKNSASGLAQQMTPADLHIAKLSLDKANAEFEANGDTITCKDQTYVAHRQIQRANVMAKFAQDQHKLAHARKMGVVVRDSQAKVAGAALRSTRDELGEANRLAKAKTEKLAEQGALLEAEKVARVAAEDKLSGAMKDLADVASVRDEARGIVITLTGGVLFASGKYKLLNTAKTKLDSVAVALLDEEDDRPIAVEGHTDSRGTKRNNATLSEKRAIAVRDYLIAKGIPAERISAKGLGEIKPMFTNSNAENRANNRRVEIVLGKGAKTSAR